MKHKRSTYSPSKRLLGDLKGRKRFTSGCIGGKSGSISDLSYLEQEKLEVFGMHEMLSWEEEASEISNEFSMDEKALVRKPTSLSTTVSKINSVVCCTQTYPTVLLPFYISWPGVQLFIFASWECAFS